MIRFSCPTCQKQLNGNDSLSGRTAHCPGCGEALTVPSAGESKWYFAVDGKRFGPVEKSQLIRLAAMKKLKSTDKVWSRPLGRQWVEAGRVPGLFSTAGIEAEPASPPVAKKKAPVRERPAVRGNALLMKKARESLKGHWGKAIAVFIVTCVISAIPVIGFFLAGPLAAGMSHFFLKLIRTGKGEVRDLFDKTGLFLPALTAVLITGLILVAAAAVPVLLAMNFMRTEMTGLALLCMFFVILIGLYLQVLYSMTFFILADGGSSGGREAVRISARWMKNHFWKFAGLQIRFTGWMLLCAATLGIGFLWLGPYMTTSQARFYEGIKEQNARPPRSRDRFTRMEMNSID
jgi:uncharacterized membrane protein